MPSPYETCPYNDIAPSARWSDAVESVENTDIDPHLGTTFCIDQSTKIATAGSCFAQHLARVLHASGFNHYCVEPAPAWLDEAQRKDFNYGVFSARYGNIYTPRQLLQLIQRALGQFEPAEPAWELPGGRVADPFRPRIQPNGFESTAEMEADREAHLDAVRSMLVGLDVLVFTLGLTEAWRSRVDGAIFPIAPGCGAGRFDTSCHEFHNFRVAEVIDDLSRSIALLQGVNPNAKVLLTVSPVPLVATMTERHILQATVYSKSVLRAAAEEISLTNPSVSYFAAYEIAVATLNAQNYFAGDKRSATEALVSHVMRSFFGRFAPGVSFRSMSEAATVPLAAEAPATPAQVVCDEQAIAEALAAQISRRD
jgi:hypothetical protein